MYRHLLEPIYSYMFVLNRRAKITELKHLEQNHHFASQQRYKRFLRPPYLSITDIVYKKKIDHGYGSNTKFFFLAEEGVLFTASLIGGRPNR
jgi:hypothetical protein